MAQKLKNFEFSRGKNNYKWDKWCDGSKWKLEIGKDFLGSLQLFRASFSAHCKKIDLQGRTQTTDDKKFVIIQAVGPEVTSKPVKKKRPRAK